MKKLHILDHAFELDEKAYSFVSRYISNIEQYAKTHDISSDVLDDIKYRIVEKLYTYDVPITEKQVISIANTIWDPQDIFVDVSDDQNWSDVSKSIDKNTWWYFAKDGPMIWWVCYRLSKSLNINVTIVRVLMIILILFWWLSIWVYPILALFVPYVNKSKTTWAMWQLLYEFIRWLLFTVLIFGLLFAFLSLVGVWWFLSFTPPINNQSISLLMPKYLYVAFAVMWVALLVLLIWSIWWLLKKNWISRTHALISIIMIVLSGIVIWWTWYKMVLNGIANGGHEQNQTQTISDIISTNNIINISINWSDKRWHVFAPDIFDRNFSRYIRIVPVSWDDARVDIKTTIYAIEKDHIDQTITHMLPISITWWLNQISITLPDQFASQVVPLTLVDREITINIPTDAEIDFDDTYRSWHYFKNQHWFSKEVSSGDTTYNTYYNCLSDTTYIYDNELDAFRCKDFTPVVHDDVDLDDEDDDIYEDNQIDLD